MAESLFDAVNGGSQALIPLQRRAARSEFIPVNAEEDRLLRTSIPSRSSKKSADAMKLFEQEMEK